VKVLNKVVSSVELFNQEVEQRVCEARNDAKVGAGWLQRWGEIQRSIPQVITPTGISLPRLPLPELDEPGLIARYLCGEGLPGEFPFLSSVYPEMYLEPEDGSKPQEEPTRLFAGLGTAEETNARFHLLTKSQQSHRLSTAFDGPTLYGMDSDADGVFGKIGEGGVAVDTVEDMERLFDGFDLSDPQTSVSMTINGPAPTIMAMYVAAAKRRFSSGVEKVLRGTVQADILKEVQGQNEVLFPVAASLRFLLDMMEHSVSHFPKWYPVSISGYHISQAGATPVQQAAYTLSNGFAYAEMMRERGVAVDVFAPRFSFFFDCGVDVEFIALSRVCRKIWAIGMRDVFDGDLRSQRLKMHTQTSGRSLVSAEFKNNLTRTALEMVMAYMNATNSCHSNSADEPFTTPSEEYVKLASHGQSILLEESGLFRHMMNGLSGSPGMKAVERAVEAEILKEFAEIERLGGVLGAMEHRYQRSQIQAASYRYEQQILSGERRVIGLNRYADSSDAELPSVVRVADAVKLKQVERVRAFKLKNKEAAAEALDGLSQVVENGGNVFAQLIETVEVCSLGQITERLQRDVGVFRPMI
jgi:methylmalonyl-CoA mutase cobalamin-binding domain/chain